ncbi:MAG: LemA family protein [Phycisphaerae bacterium]|nr:LemA family protein [Phycisphaerae bacterium]
MSTIPASSITAPAVTVACIVLAVLLVWIVVAFNRLIRRRNLMREGWSGIDVQLKMRRNLIPNLVEAVKGYSEHEKAALERIAVLRSQGEKAADVAEANASENALTRQIKGLFALAERYPDLKASKNFIELQEQLAEIEDQIQMARRYYNGAVRNYNTLAQSFPSNLVAGVFGFRRGEFFEIETATDRQVPEVEI